MTMDDALRIALNIEALEKSRETRRRVVEPSDEYWDDEPRKKRGKPSRLLAKTVDIANDEREPEPWGYFPGFGRRWQKNACLAGRTDVNPTDGGLRA